MEKQRRVKRAEKLIKEMGCGVIWTLDENCFFLYIYFTREFKGELIKVDDNGDFDISRLTRDRAEIAKDAAQKLNLRAYW